MSNLILDNISLILLLPLWVFIIIMSGRFLGISVNNKIIVILTLFSSFLGTLICSIGLRCLNDSVEWTLPFIKINDFSILFGIHIDKISLIIALILFLVSFLVQLYSVSYMKEEPKKYRFFALLNLFNFAMAFLLFSPNLFQLYVFWELVSVISYLLVGFEYNNCLKTLSARKMFIMNRIGDTALLAGVLLSSHILYSFVPERNLTTLPLQRIGEIGQTLSAYSTETVFGVIMLCFIVSAIIKSAQFPFHTWLQDAMEAKIPVSALLHSATMVISGVYLIIRLMPLLNNVFLAIISIIGFSTALLCSIFALLETHPKKTLAYSTSANIGLMFAIIGTSNIMPALIFLAAHAFTKSMLFMVIPDKNKNLSHANLILMIIGALSLAGILLSGFCAKEILFGIFSNNCIFQSLLIVISFIGAFYIIKFVLLIYKNSHLTKETDFIKTISIFGLLTLNIFLYTILNKNHFEINLLLVMAILGSFTAYVLYKLNILHKINSERKYLELIYGKFVPDIYSYISECAAYLDKNLIYVYTFLTKIIKFGVNILGWLENNIMLKSVEKTAEISKTLSKQYMILQTGNIQTYNAYAFVFVTIIITLIILGYMIIIGQIS